MFDITSDYGELHAVDLSRSTPALVTASGARAIVVLPVDYLRSTQQTRQAMTEIDSRARAELRATSIEVQTTGRVSDRLRGEMTKMRWTLRERIPPAR